MPRDLLNFSVGSIEILVVWCISAMENHYNVQKIAADFRQVPLKGVLLSVNVLECFGKTF